MELKFNEKESKSIKQDNNKIIKYAYYKGFFKVHQVEIVAVNDNGWSSNFKELWKYTIKFKNGKFKNVSSNKLSFECD